MKTIEQMWLEMEAKGCKVVHTCFTGLLVVDNGFQSLGAGPDRATAVLAAYATLRPDSPEADALRRAVQQCVTPQEAEDRSNCPAGYTTSKVGDKWIARQDDMAWCIAIGRNGGEASDWLYIQHPSEPAAIAACWAHRDRQRNAQPPAADPDAELAARLLSLTRDGYRILRCDDGLFDWWRNGSCDVNQRCDLPAAIAAAEAHRRERQQPKPVWYCLVPGRGEPRVPHKVQSDAVTEAARLASLERRPVQVLGVVQVVQPDQT